MENQRRKGHKGKGKEMAKGTSKTGRQSKKDMEMESRETAFVMIRAPKSLMVG
jgi:hypothetical protein